MFRKVTSITICVLYFSLSLFSISCAYHCSFKDELPASLQHSDTDQSTEHAHDHHHSSSDDQQDDSGHSKILFCKFVHKVGGSVITASQIVIAGLGFSLHEAPFNIAVVNQRTVQLHLSRAPPADLS